MAFSFAVRKNIFKIFNRVEKRLRFVLSALLMAGFFVFASFFEFHYVWLFVPLFIIGTYFFTYFSVLEGIEKIEWLMLFLMPVLFTVSFYLFFHLFPIRWLTRLPFITIYGISFYAILLTSNIFNVGVEKNLQLYRAAFSVNYFYQSVLVFLLSNVLLSFKFNFLVNAFFTFLFTFPLTIQLFWTVNLDRTLEKKIRNYSLLSTFLITQLMALMSFIPLKATILSLFITGSYYSINGLLYHHQDDRLFPNVIREYLLVLGFVFLIVLLSINW